MRIAICSLARFTHVAEFVDAAKTLGEHHEVRYFTGVPERASLELLRSYEIEYVRLPVRDEHTTSQVLAKASTTCSVFALFTDYFLRYAEAVLPSLVQALKRWQPDLILAHLRDFAGMTAAEILDVPMVSFGSHGSADRCQPLDPPFGAGISRLASRRELQFMWRMQRAFEDHIGESFNGRLRRPFGLSPIQGFSTLHSERLTLLCLIPELDNRNTSCPAHIQFVGSQFSRRGAVATADEHRLLERIAAMPKPRVFLSFGTTHTLRLAVRCLAALRGFHGSLVLTLAGGQQIPVGYRHNLITSPFFADVEGILELCDAQVTAAGGKSVMEAQNKGKPLVCLPQQGEQRELALALAEHGAAEVPCTRRWDDAAFAAAVDRVCAEPTYAEAAGRLRRKVHAMDGPRLAAALIEAAVG